MKQRFETFLEEYFKENKFLGISCGIVDQEETRFFSFGLAKPTQGAPFTEKTVCAIGSTTKIFTAVLTMQARRRGELNLDSSVSDFFSGSDYMKQQFHDVTILDLLTHTSGLPRDLKGKFFETGRFPSVYEMIETIESNSVIVEPRRRYRYSNLGYALLGAILEIATKKSFKELLDARISKPLGLLNLSILPEKGSEPGNRYDSTEQKYILQPTYEMSAYAPTGAIWTSVKSLTQFISTLTLAPEQLGLSSVDADRMFSVFFLKENPSVGPGLVCRFVSIDGNQFFSQSGAVPGFGSTVLVSRELGRVVVLMSNSDAFHFPAGLQLWNMLGKVEAQPFAVDPSYKLSEYVGDYYWLEKARKIRLEINAHGVLCLPESSYKPLIDDTLFVPTETQDRFLTLGGSNDGEHSVFERDSSGKVSGLWLGGLYYARA